MRDAVSSDHARSEMARRGLTELDVRRVLNAPEFVAPVRTGRIVAQGFSIVAGSEQRYLIRVFVDIDRAPPVVVTAYRTSKLAKYGDGR